MSNKKDNSAFQMIADINGDFQDLINIETPPMVPILAVRNLVLFPGVLSPIMIGRESSKALIQKAEKKNLIIGVVCQLDPDTDSPTINDLYKVGVYAKVMKLLTLPNGNITAIVQAMGRMRLLDIKVLTPYLQATVESLPEIQPERRDKEFKTAMSDLRDMVEKYVALSDEIPDEATFAIKNITNNEMALNFICSNLPFSVKEKIDLLETETVKERLFGVMKIVNRETNLQNLKAVIRNKTREEIDEQQRN
jgi:ATP-dependent Lon protease